MRPTVLTVMAEHFVDDPVWDRPSGTGEPVDLAALGVSATLVRRLRDWNAEFEAVALPGHDWESPEAATRWVAAGLALAFELQDELHDVEVRYFHDPDEPSGPVREARRRS